MVKDLFPSLLMAVVNSLAVHRVLGGKMSQAIFKLELVKTFFRRESVK